MTGDIRDFTFNSLPYRIVFGSGTFKERLSSELERLQSKRILVIATEGSLKRVGAIESEIPVVGTFSKVQEHIPISVVEGASEMLVKNRCDLVLSIGGGSATGTAKALVLTHDVKLIAVPTTYAGSEVTDVVGLTSDKVKRTVTDPRIVPDVVIYDSSLTLGLSPQFTLTSSYNALSHAFGALALKNLNPFTKRYALEAIPLILRALEAGDDHGMLDDSARDQLLLGACFAGMCLAQVGTSFHHRICHVLGGSFGLSHSKSHASMLPYTSQFMMKSLFPTDTQNAIREVFRGSDIRKALISLSNLYGFRPSLYELGLRESDLVGAVELSFGAIAPNDDRITKDDVMNMLSLALNVAN